MFGNITVIQKPDCVHKASKRSFVIVHMPACKCSLVGTAWIQSYVPWCQLKSLKWRWKWLFCLRNILSNPLHPTINHSTLPQTPSTLPRTPLHPTTNPSKELDYFADSLTHFLVSKLSLKCASEHASTFNVEPARFLGESFLLCVSTWVGHVVEKRFSILDGILQPHTVYNQSYSAALLNRMSGINFY